MIYTVKIIMLLVPSNNISDKFILLVFNGQANLESQKQVCLVHPTKTSSGNGASYHHCIGELQGKLSPKTSKMVEMNRSKPAGEIGASSSSSRLSVSKMTIPAAHVTSALSSKTTKSPLIQNIPVPQQKRTVSTIDQPITEAEEVKNITTNKPISEPKEVKTMTVEELGEVLDLLHLSEYKELFKEHTIDGALLFDITMDDLIKDFNFRRIQAKKLIKCVQENWLPNTK